MIRLKNHLSAVKRDQGGVAALEFALIAPVFMFMLMGAFDIGHSVFVRTVIDGAIQKAARDAALETGANQLTNIDANLVEAIKAVAPNATVVPKRESYFSFNDVDRAEIFTDSDGDGVCNNNEIFEDENGNEEWDEDVGELGIGGPKDIVQYTVTVTYPTIFTFNGFERQATARVNGEIKDTSYSLGKIAQQRTFTATTILKNQPFGAQSQATSTTQNCA